MRKREEVRQTAAVKTLEEVFEEIKRSGRLDTIEDYIVLVNYIFELQGTLDMKNNEVKYLPS